MQKPLVNRVAQSGLITLKLEEFFPEGEVTELDLKDYLFKGLVLREKDFRTAMKEHDWDKYAGKNLMVHCSADAIVPVWAYMLVATYASPRALRVFMGTSEEFYRIAFQETLQKLDPASFEGRRVVIKGCGDKPVPPSAYLDITCMLMPFAKSIMYGEPCSTVPLYKRPKD